MSSKFEVRSSKFHLEDIRGEAERIIAKYDERRAALLPVLHLVQERHGHISPEAEEAVGKIFDLSTARVHEVVSFYTLYQQRPIGKHHLQICMNMSCKLRGADAILQRIERRLGITSGRTTPDGTFTLSSVECLCACEAAPMMQVNETYVGPLTPALVDHLLDHPTQPQAMWPTFQGGIEPEHRLLSQRFNTPNGHTLDAYLKDGGYQAAKQVFTHMMPDEVISAVTQSNLRGLGGAGFPTGKKWAFIPPPAEPAKGRTDAAASASGGSLREPSAGGGIIPKDTAKPHYLVVNADEGEPGTFKDRYLLERDPHLLIEGMLIASYATGCRKAYVYIRGEYVQPFQRFSAAVEEARQAGYVGDKIFGAQHSLEIVVHRGAGAYICGEETALLESLEGKKGFPRLKPPFPAIAGLFGCPTVINNVETLALVPAIISRGAEAFATLGTARQGGTRLYSVSGHVAKPGLYECSPRVTLRQLIYDYAGGIPNGRSLKAVIPGGISAKILTAKEIDVVMDFDSLLQAGTMAGSAGVMVMDETVCMVEALQTAAHFFHHESCGQCSPCREGTGWIEKIAQRLLRGEGRPNDLEVLLGVAGNMEGRTICVFADAAAWPVQSYISKFREEFEFHIREKRCNVVNASANARVRELAHA